MAGLTNKLIRIRIRVGIYIELFPHLTLIFAQLGEAYI